MLSGNENIGIHPDEIKNDIARLSSIKGELESITKQVYNNFYDAKSAKRGVDIDFLTDSQEDMINNIEIHNQNASNIIETLNTLVKSYQEENDELITNIVSAKPNQT